MTGPKKARGLRAALGLLWLGLLGSCATGGGSGALPDFSLPDLSGHDLRLSELVGKQVIYLDFWATWCGPCAAEMPALQHLYETYKSQGLVVVAVSMDDPSTQGSVASFAHRSGLTFPVVIDTGSLATSYYNPTHSAPYGVLIGRSGKIIEQHSGYTPGDEVPLEAKIREQL